MKRSWINAEYTTSVVADNVLGGFVAVELYKRTDETTVLMARLIYWDASGQYFLEMKVVDELPLTIVESLIAEAKAEVGESVIR